MSFKSASEYFFDLNDKDRIINFDKNFIFINEDDIYPSYCYNYKRFNYLDFIFNYNQESVYYIFKNDNQYDLRKNNIEIYHIYHKIISQKYEIIEYINGHYLNIGQDANMMKNPIWKVNENGKYSLNEIAQPYIDDTTRQIDLLGKYTLFGQPNGMFEIKYPNKDIKVTISTS